MGKQSLLSGIFQTLWGKIIIIIAVFYAITFLVYYFYSPGPEERRTANEEGLPPTVSSVSQVSSIQVKNTLLTGQTEQNPNIQTTQQ